MVQRWRFSILIRRSHQFFHPECIRPERSRTRLDNLLPSCLSLIPPISPRETQIGYNFHRMLETNPLNQIQNYLKISETISTSGQPLEPHFKEIGRAGFEVVINLAPSSIPNELELCRESGLAYVHIPVKWQEPRQDQLLKFFSFLSVNGEFRIFVHCTNNMRTSVFIYLYRILINHEIEGNCRADLLKIWNPDETWQGFIENSLKELKGKARIIQWPFEW